MAEEDDMKKLRPTQLWTPLITVESEEESSAMPTMSTLSFIRKKTFLTSPRQDEDGTSSGISDQCNSDADSNFSPSPSGSYKEADFITNSDSSIVHSDEDFIEEDLTTPLSPLSPKRSGSPSRSRHMLSPWSAVKKAMTAWSPFMQVYRKKYPWVQLAGHQGNFKPGGMHGTVLKKASEREQEALEGLMVDRMKPFVPEFHKLIVKEDGTYIEMQDLLRDFEKPAVMDVKMGTRTYLEEELMKARSKEVMRKDMYEKMIAVDPSEPTEEEHKQKAITKPRYMQWRENISSSATLGFRIEGIKTTGSNPKKNFKMTKSEEDVRQCLCDFIAGNASMKHKIHSRLLAIRCAIEESAFFQTHEVIGSSLLFVYDESGQANVWVIDFAKATPLPKGVQTNHRSEWQEGNHEDGYLFGLDNLIRIWSTC